MKRHRLGSFRQIYVESGPILVGCWHVPAISEGDTIDMSTAFSRVNQAVLMTAQTDLGNLVINLASGSTGTEPGLSPHGITVKVGAGGPSVTNRAAYLLANGDSVTP